MQVPFVIYEAGWHFDGSRYGKNRQNEGYSGLLTEKSFQNKWGKVDIFAKLEFSASRKYILLHTYFMKVFQ